MRTEEYRLYLQERGVTGEEIEIISVDGGKGLLAALPVAYRPSICTDLPG